MQARSHVRLGITAPELSRARVGIYVATCIDKHMEREVETIHASVLQNAHMSGRVYMCVRVGS